VPALIDSGTGTIYGLSNIPQFNDFAIRGLLEERCRLPVRMQNDANCFVLGEKHAGFGRPYRDMVGLTTGTGVGAGIIIGNRLYNGTHHGAGEFGMIPYRDKCFETYCSGQFFADTYQTSGEQLASRASAGDTEALEAFITYGRHLGELVNLICYVLDPQLIVIGGAVSRSFHLYRKGLVLARQGFYFRHRKKTRVVPSATPDAAILGAVSLFTGEDI
jgi:glucokinase